MVNWLHFSKIIKWQQVPGHELAASTVVSHMMWLLSVMYVLTMQMPRFNLHFRVGGWTNPFEKYKSKWESSPNRDESKQYLKPPPSFRYTPEKINIAPFRRPCNPTKEGLIFHPQVLQVLDLLGFKEGMFRRLQSFHTQQKKTRTQPTPHLDGARKSGSKVRISGL